MAGCAEGGKGRSGNGARIRDSKRKVSFHSAADKVRALGADGVEGDAAQGDMQ